ncbi:endonuclease/exonuclease/phosphatase family domain-containing protein 1-like [Ptychodera flava]|uniref:endonuclease/exonuclease/phosphatase family domain-containing protein 1-like n=1 Tax=Ptychodera flava TaxID=63121 RepID=UPI003969D30F
MGNNMITTCCGRCPKKSRLRSDYDLVPHVKGRKRGDLSATYSAKDLTYTFNKLNINTATEEELMTLPGVTRVVARNIVDYRQQIGGFRKVEDLALVTGVGAVKLAHIRPEICASTKNGNGTPRGSDGGISRSSSATGSRINTASQHTQYVHGQQSKHTDINTATVAQLSRTNELGEHLAKKIIHYRNTNGPFNSYEQIRDIPGIGQATLDKIQDHITLGEMEYLNNRVEFTVGEVPRRRLHRTNSRSSYTQTDFAMLQLQPSTDPPSADMVRDPVEEFTGVKNGLPIIRIGSWNLTRFGKDKASNRGVMEVVCRTILENGLSIISFQELMDQESLIMVCNELNRPTLPNVVEWKGHRGRWECQVSEVAGRIDQSLEYNGFLWDKSRSISLRDAWLLDQVRKPQHQQFARHPYIGLFQAAKLEVVMVSVHLKSSDTQGQVKDKNQGDAKKLPYLIESLQTELAKVNDILISGDFNTSPHESEFLILKNLGFTSSVSATTFTNINSRNPGGSYSHDNIWMSKGLQNVNTGEMGVIRTGLQHPWIPDGWKWNGYISEHCPVWTEIYVSEQLDLNGDVVNQRNSSRIDNGSISNELQSKRHQSYSAMLNGEIDAKTPDLQSSEEDVFLPAL